MIFRLKELREKREMSQVRLGVELGINQDVISRYENLEREADYRTLLDIADFLMCLWTIFSGARITRRSTNSENISENLNISLIF